MAIYRKYYKEIKCYLGVPVTPTEIRKGEFIEEAEYDSLEACENDVYTLVEVPGYICDLNSNQTEYCRYKKMQKYYNGKPSDPAQYVPGDVILCGCTKDECDGSPRFRQSLGTMCSGYFTLYNINKKQQSLDCGKTWQDTDEYSIIDVNSFSVDCGTGNNNCGILKKGEIDIPTNELIFESVTIRYAKIWTQNNKTYMFVAADTRGGASTKTKIYIYEILPSDNGAPTVNRLYYITSSKRMYFTAFTLRTINVIPYIDETNFYFMHPSYKESGNYTEIYILNLSTGILTNHDVRLSNNEKFANSWYFRDNKWYGIGLNDRTSDTEPYYRYIQIDLSGTILNKQTISGIVKPDTSDIGLPLQMLFNEKTEMLEVSSSLYKKNQNVNFDKLIKINPITLEITSTEDMMYNVENFNLMHTPGNEHVSYYGDMYLTGGSLNFLKYNNCLRVYNNSSMSYYYYNNKGLNVNYDVPNKRLYIEYEYY